MIKSDVVTDTINPLPITSMGFIMEPLWTGMGVIGLGLLVLGVVFILRFLTV